MKRYFVELFILQPFQLFSASVCVKSG